MTINENQHVRGGGRLKATSPAPRGGTRTGGEPTGSGSEADAELTYSIGELAEEFDITTRTIRFYESRGLITPRRAGTSRIYSRRDRGRLMLILRGKNLGFSLEDVAEYLKLYDIDPSQRAQTELLIGKVDAAIADLDAKRADLERSLRDLKELRAKCAEFLRSINAEAEASDKPR
ncbi:MAG: MerR family DNA-binding transcriptional regulator [Hyphomicrobiaceae bacterium]|nr:MerR family DNA-binding transcriptional regulator [Hyphomicrobiaceae bacterium]